MVPLLKFRYRRDGTIYRCPPPSRNGYNRFSASFLASYPAPTPACDKFLLVFSWYLSLSLPFSLEGEEKSFSPKLLELLGIVLKGGEVGSATRFHTVRIKKVYRWSILAAEKLRQVLRNASFSRRPLIDSHTVACEVCKAFALEGITYVYMAEGNVSRPCSFLFFFLFFFSSELFNLFPLLIRH